jgi:head-tail adaptor
MALDAGDLDRRVTLLRAVPFPGDVGDDVVWVPLATVWAKRTPILDAERNHAAAVQAVVTHRYLIRWSPEVEGLSGADQLDDVTDGQPGARCGIVAVKPHGGRREGLELTVAELNDGEVAD